MGVEGGERWGLRVVMYGEWELKVGRGIKGGELGEGIRVEALQMGMFVRLELGVGMGVGNGIMKKRLQ